MAPSTDLVEALRARFAASEALARAALAQVPPEALARPLPGETSAEGQNSVAVLLHHVGGNLRSRFADFLTADGEKPSRDRDGEFDPDVAPEAALAAWDAGWTALYDALGALTDVDLARTVTIRTAPHTVADALFRALAHVSLHVGQIVLLAKHHAGAAWTPLSIPRGESARYAATPFANGPVRG